MPPDILNLFVSETLREKEVFGNVVDTSINMVIIL